MKGKRVVRRGVLWHRGIPGNDYGRGAQGQARGCQCWHVEYLAEMAGCIRAMRVLVENGKADRKVQQRSAR